LTLLLDEGVILVVVDSSSSSIMKQVSLEEMMIMMMMMKRMKISIQMMIDDATLMCYRSRIYNSMMLKNK